MLTISENKKWQKWQQQLLPTKRDQKNLYLVNVNNATPKLNRDLRVRKIVLRLLQRAHS